MASESHVILAAWNTNKGDITFETNESKFENVLLVSAGGVIWTDTTVRGMEDMWFVQALDVECLSRMLDLVPAADQDCSDVTDTPGGKLVVTTGGEVTTTDNDTDVYIVGGGIEIKEESASAGCGRHRARGRTARSTPARGSS